MKITHDTHTDELRSHFSSGSKQTAVKDERLAARMVSKVAQIKVQPTLFKVSENSLVYKRIKSANQFKSHEK